MQEAHKIGYTIVSEGDVSSVSDTNDSEKNPTSPNRSGARTCTQGCALRKISGSPSGSQPF